MVVLVRARADGSVFGIFFEWVTGWLCWLVSLPWPGLFTPPVLPLFLYLTGTQEALKRSLGSSCSYSGQIRLKQVSAVLVLQVYGWRCGARHNGPQTLYLWAKMPDIVLKMDWEFWIVPAKFSNFPTDWILGKKWRGVYLSVSLSGIRPNIMKQWLSQL